MSENDDWRSNIRIKDARMRTSFHTSEYAYSLIIQAAVNRHMHPSDFVGRAALAVAAHDLDLPFKHCAMYEHEISDRRTHRARHRSGADFGPWEIGEMHESR